MMSKETCPVLIVDDEPDIRDSIQRSLQREETASETASDIRECLEKLRSGSYCVLVLDNQLPDGTGSDLLDTLRTEGFLPDLLVIMITAYGTIESGLEAIQKGCYDYAVKPFNMEDLLFRIRRALETVRLRRSLRTLSDAPRFRGMIGLSEEIRKVFHTIRMIGPNDVVVLVEGETGTGKELVARALHEESRRAQNAFIPINCGAIPEALIESELFGYEKGAFTGAARVKFGLLETAEKGTVFLDEINSLPALTQVKLLRFIETGEYIKVGGQQIKQADVRIIAASNQDMEELVRTGKFREDLFFRLNMIRLRLPPLVRRKEDIPLLTEHFAAFFNGHFGKSVRITPEVLNFFMDYEWKGNVRELRNVVQHMILMSSSGTAGLEDLPGDLKASAPRPVRKIRSFKEAKNEAVQEFETAYFSDLLRRHKGNILRAAEAAEMDRKHLTTRIKELGLKADDFRKKKD